MKKKRIHKLFSLYIPYKGRFLLVLISALLVSGLSLLYPLCTRYITQIVMSEEHALIAPKIIQTGLFMIVIVLLERGLNAVYDYYGHCLGAAMENDLRFMVFEHMERLPVSYYDRTKPGQMMSMLTNDLLSLAELLHHGPEDYIIYFVKFAGASVILFMIHWQLALIVFLFMPIMAVLTLFFSRKEKKTVKENQRQIGNINARAEDTFAGIRDVKGYTREAAHSRLFRQEGGLFLKNRRSQYRVESISYQSIMLMSRIIYVTVVLVGGDMIVRGNLGIPDLLAFLLYISYLTEPVEKLAWMTTQFQQGMAGFERVMDVMDLPIESDKDSGMVLLGQIDIQHVSFRYETQDKNVLEDLNFSVKAGDHVGIVGISGRGKSTLSSLLTGFYRPQKGQILLDGKTQEEIGVMALRRNIAVVRQENYLFDGTIRENIRMGREESSEEEIRMAAEAAQIHDFIMSLPDAYETQVGPKGIRLSGGQKQRICIARAFLRNAPILILDEATSALDMETEECLMQRMLEIRKEKTTLVISHRPMMLQRMDFIIDLNEKT